MQHKKTPYFPVFCSPPGTTGPRLTRNLSSTPPARSLEPRIAPRHAVRSRSRCGHGKKRPTFWRSCRCRPQARSQHSDLAESRHHLGAAARAPAATPLWPIQVHWLPVCCHHHRASLGDLPTKPANHAFPLRLIEASPPPLIVEFLCTRHLHLPCSPPGLQRPTRRIERNPVTLWHRPGA